MIDALMVARHMFERNATAYNADAGMISQMWESPDIRAFWLGEATSVLEFMGYAHAEQ